MRKLMSLLLILVMLGSVITPAVAIEYPLAFSGNGRDVGVESYHVTVHGIPMKVIVVEEKSKLKHFSKQKVKSILEKRLSKEYVFEKYGKSKVEVKTVAAPVIVVIGDIVLEGEIIYCNCRFWLLFC